MAIQKVRPTFTATNVITGEERTDTVVLEANTDHNTDRKARLERVEFRNDLDPQQALDAVCDSEGEVDIVTEVSPEDAERVEGSEHAKLETIAANRMLVGIFNTYPEDGAPLHKREIREALTLAVDRDAIISDGLKGYADPLAALTPAWAGAKAPEIEPRAHDPERAKQLLEEAGWPEGRALVIAAPVPFEGVARMIAADVESALGIDTDVAVVPDEEMTAGSLALIEKKIVPPWDILIHAWFDLSSDLTPAVVHREFFGDDGAFRCGPVDPEFDWRFQAIVAKTDADGAREAAEEVDRYCYAEAKALFICAPHALYAVNNEVDFKSYRTTFELADTEVSGRHWSRRNGG